ncbi:hypothetical protein ACC754_41250, partial [Rhizobium johnstonii]
LTESRRLSLRAHAARRPLFLVLQAGAEEASSAALRLHFEPAPSALQPLPDGSTLSGSIRNTETAEPEMSSLYDNLLRAGSAFK